MATESAAMIALRSEAKRLGWPERFIGDLEHDARSIARAPHEPFAWGIGPWGTHIAHHDSALRMRMVADAFRGNPCRFYVWDGTTLIAMESAGATMAACAADSMLAKLAGARRVAALEMLSLVDELMGEA